MNIVNMNYAKVKASYETFTNFFYYNQCLH